MIIYSKKTKDLNIPKGLGNVAVDVMSGTTDTISRDEAISLVRTGDLRTLSQSKAYTDQKAAAANARIDSTADSLRRYTDNAMGEAVSSAETYTILAMDSQLLRLYEIINEATSAQTLTYNLTASSTTEERETVLSSSYGWNDRWRSIRVTYPGYGTDLYSEADVYSISDHPGQAPLHATLHLHAETYSNTDGKFHLKHAELNASAFTVTSDFVIDPNEAIEAFWLTGYTMYWDTAVESINALFDRVDELYNGAQGGSRFYKLRVFIAMGGYGDYVCFHPVTYNGETLTLAYTGIYNGSDYNDGICSLRLDLRRDTPIQEGDMIERHIAYTE